MAELIANEAVPDLLERARRVMEVTNCSEDVALLALHEFHFDAELAVDNVLSTPKVRNSLALILCKLYEL